MELKIDKEFLDEAVQKAVKDIKQNFIPKDVLDNIRAEIEEYKSRQLTLAIGVQDLEKGKQIALEYVLAIIDKYKAESEEDVCKGCYYNDGEVHAECVICDKAESEE